MIARPDSSPAPRFYLCFVDFETTGLEPRAGAEPIEVAALLTDDRLVELARYESLIIASSRVEDWDPFSIEAHTRSGLLAQIAALEERNPVESRARVGAGLEAFLGRATGAPLHLAGSSIHFDRGFLEVYWPELAQRFHHRRLDVSSVRLAGQVFTAAPPLGGETPHRAMADVLRSLEELRYWRKALAESGLPEGTRLDGASEVG